MSYLFAFKQTKHKYYDIKHLKLNKTTIFHKQCNANRLKVKQDKTRRVLRLRISYKWCMKLL